MKYETMPFDVIPADAGKELCRNAYEGHIAVIICVTAVAPPADCTPNQNNAKMPLETTAK